MPSLRLWGAKWWYVAGLYSPTSGNTLVAQGVLKYEVIKDTLIQEKPCKQIYRVESDGIPYEVIYIASSPDTFYVHQNNSEVYVYHPPTQKFLLQYDFSLNVGDTLISRLRCNKFIQILIETVDTVKINDIALRQIKGRNVLLDLFWQSNSFVATEKIGLFEGLFLDEIAPIQDYFCQEVSDSYVSATGLRCYEDTEIGLYHNAESTSPTCDYYEFTGIATNEAAAYTLPCRVGGQTIYFQLAQPPTEALSMDIYDMLGQQLYSGSYTDAQDLYLPNNQPYIAVLKQDHIFIQSQIFKL
ncbi:MAG: hypothetical protein IPL35_09070 [Sphingobacteriales bacterium]|nr:hypothetical protein [Sphingobacteriales bacterium]